jgi:hypothetical protein
MQICGIIIQEVAMQNTKPIMTFSGWRFPPPVLIDGAHQFVPIGKPCCKGCAHCGFPADYPLHKKAA